MPVRLGRFEMPKRLTKEDSTATPTFARFFAEPFETGYGHTVGNSLRRDRRPFQRREQDTAKGVADGVTVAGLKRVGKEPGVSGGGGRDRFCAPRPRL